MANGKKRQHINLVGNNSVSTKVRKKVAKVKSRRGSKTSVAKSRARARSTR